MITLFISVYNIVNPLTANVLYITTEIVPAMQRLVQANPSKIANVLKDFLFMLSQSSEIAWESC